jgi:hypothetical protein
LRPARKEEALLVVAALSEGQFFAERFFVRRMKALGDFCFLYRLLSVCL